MTRTFNILGLLCLLLLGAIGGAGAQSGQDTFVGTAGTSLISHTPTPSGGFTYANVTGSIVLDGNGGVYGTVTSTNHLQALLTPATADYTIEADAHFFTINANDPAESLTLRDNGSSWYQAQVESTDIKLYKIVSGVFTQMGSTYTIAPTVGQTTHIKCVVNGTSLTVNWGATTAISVTDSAITVVGHPGLYTYIPATSTIPTASVGMHLQNYSVTPATTLAGPPAQIAVTDTNLFWSGFFLSGSIYAQSANAGSYLKAAFTGTSVAVNCDSSPETNGSFSVSNVHLAYQVDSGPRQNTILSSQPIVVTGLAAGTHTLQVWYQNDSDVTTQEWGSASTDPANALRITSLSVDSGASTVPLSSTPLSLRPKRAMIWGDSITKGTYNTGGDLSGADASLSFSALVGTALNAEYVQDGCGGTGYTVGYAPNSLPTFPNTWNKYDYQHNRTLTGYDYFINCHGTNDWLGNSAAANSTVALAVSAQLTAERAASSTAQIFVVLPFGSNTSHDVATGGGVVFRHDAIVAGFNSYQLATPDSKCYLIDAGSQFISPLEKSGITNGSDNIHPNVIGNARIAPVVVDLIQAALGGVIAVAPGRGRILN